MSSYVFPEYSMASSGADMASAGGGAAAAGSGINWGGIGAMSGASALSGILQKMYEEQQRKKQREMEILAKQSSDAGQYGQNQQNQLGQLMSNWNRALGV